MPPVVRVVLAGSASSVSVGCRGNGTWFGVEGGAYQALEAAGAGPWRLTNSQGRLCMDGRALPCAEAELNSTRSVVALGDIEYRGRLLVKANARGSLAVLNLVEPEDYLCSVVGSEMYPSWPLNALMAQAVAARSYMVYATGTKGFLSRLDLAYKGISGERHAPTLAAELTRGIVLTCGGEILPAYFHSTCGGRTASAARVFGERPMGPLSGVACDWCRDSPTYRWRAVMGASELAEVLRSKGIRQVRSIVPEQTEPDGYARFVLVNGDVRLDANAFRLLVGPGQVKSTSFRVSKESGDFVFEGRGFGHGAGLCQWGAHGMARAGRSWQEILEHYYPGAKLQRVY